MATTVRVHRVPHGFITPWGIQQTLKLAAKFMETDYGSPWTQRDVLFSLTKAIDALDVYQEGMERGDDA